MPRIAAILVYPVVGCRGMRVKTAVLSARGLAGDRQWAVTSNGAVLGHAELGRVFVEQRGSDLWLLSAGMDRLPLNHSTTASAWFSKLLSRPVEAKPLPPEQAGGAPLATATASLGRLNQALPERVDAERFQPNFVLEGTDPFVEDQWLSVSIAGVRCAASTPAPPLLPFGVVLTPKLEGTMTVQLRAGQSLDVEPGVRSDRPV